MSQSIFILIFGLLLGVPFIYWADKFPNIEKYIRIIVGTISILFGLLIIYNLLKY